MVVGFRFDHLVVIGFSFDNSFDSFPFDFSDVIIIIIIIIIIILLDLLARFRPRTINKLSEGDSDARGSGRMNKWITGRPN